ncbi:MAG: polysaccharide pyruvyl transferase CsaB [Oscillospiraceae bacterium]|nr:polysaccharide pyruvyl transferase CsaB [Oscillospiraceae bacterium]
MKIIHLISGGDVGGAKTHVLSLLAGLTKTEQARLVCFTEGDFAAEARQLGIDTHVVGGGLPSVLRTLRTMIAEDGFEIVHCHGARANLIGSLLRRRLGVPVVTTVHSDYRLDYLGRPLGRLTYGTINTVALRFLDYYIGVSDSMGDLLIGRGFDPQRIFSIYNGVDFTGHQPSLDRAAYLESVGCGGWDGSVVVGIAARLSAVKDVATLIRAFGLACKSCDNIRLLIAGDGEQRAELEKLAAQCCPAGKYCFAAWIMDTDSFYHALDVNTLTSLSETFPYALTEGARMHCATVASRVGGVPRLIEDGVCGLLFEPKDDKTLAAHLCELAKDAALRVRLGDALYEKAAREFSVEATVRRQREIYETILRRKARSVGKRDGVLICGAYGRGNAGDDAILEAIVGQMRAIDPDIPLYVLSRTPKKTSARHRIGSVYTFRFLRFCRVARRTKLYINGGGSLIQDVTSSRSLWYYLLNITAAKKLGNRVLMYGCGIGPVKKARNRRLAGRVLDRNADIITLRDNYSAEELGRMHVTKPKIRVTADPAFLLEGAPDEAAAEFLRRKGIAEDERFAFYAIRGWKGMDGAIPAIAEAARTAWQRGLRPVFLAMEPQTDLATCRKAAAAVGGGVPVFSAPEESALLISILRRAGLVVAMRLHALVFAAGVGTPLTGISYDPKVEAFLDYMGQSGCPSVENVTAEALLHNMQLALDGAENAREKARQLRVLSSENRLAAKKLLEDAK